MVAVSPSHSVTALLSKLDSSQIAQTTYRFKSNDLEGCKILISVDKLSSEV